jgi:hypothetical protein
MVAAVLLAGPGVAQAHLITSGLGPLCDGALHGLLNGSALPAIGASWPELLGIVTTVLLVTLLISAAVVPNGAGSLCASSAAGSLRSDC